MPKKTDLNLLRDEFNRARAQYGKPQFFHYDFELPGGVHVLIYAGRTKLRSNQMEEAIQESLERLSMPDEEMDSWR